MEVATCAGGSGSTAAVVAGASDRAWNLCVDPRFGPKTKCNKFVANLGDVLHGPIGLLHRRYNRRLWGCRARAAARGSVVTGVRRVREGVKVLVLFAAYGKHLGNDGILLRIAVAAPVRVSFKVVVPDLIEAGSGVAINLELCAQLDGLAGVAVVVVCLVPVLYVTSKFAALVCGPYELVVLGAFHVGGGGHDLVKRIFHVVFVARGKPVGDFAVHVDSCVGVGSGQGAHPYSA